ncbi:MAG: DUF1415 domain-containing protein [Methylococcaceae bacterium]|nr:DUF1415 domain-containing protein [Methylococcaceae bacterium]
MYSSEKIIEHTKKWIDDVIIACRFCPFAAQVVKQQQVHFAVETGMDSDSSLDAVVRELTRLDNDCTIETSFLIFPYNFCQFDDFLELVWLAERQLKQNGYVGIYQLASFHPLYLFANSDEHDAANYTNRSIYPMLHFLREASIDKVLEHYKDPENIPTANIDFARKKGLISMKILRDTCLY